MKINRTYIAIAGALVFALAAITFVYMNQTPTGPTPTQQVTQSSTITLTIQSLYTNKPINVAHDETLLKVMRELNTQDPELALITKEYAGIGALVTSMHGWVNGADKKYWHYKVNGVMPQVGAGDYRLKNGDSIEWYFSASQE